MIAIINKTEELSLGMGRYGEGRQIYSLQINNKRLCTFEHIFEDGLATCLYEAAKAAKKWEKEEAKKKDKLLEYTLNMLKKEEMSKREAKHV